MTQLTDDQRKLLTEMIGECVPEYGVDADGFEAPCNKCKKWRDEHPNRPFTTWPDLGLVKEAIERAGKNEFFCSFVVDRYYSQFGPYDFVHYRYKDLNPHILEWLNPSRFCLLAAEWAESLPEWKRWWK